MTKNKILKRLLFLTFSVMIPQVSATTLGDLPLILNNGDMLMEVIDSVSSSIILNGMEDKKKDEREKTEIKVIKEENKVLKKLCRVKNEETTVLIRLVDAYRMNCEEEEEYQNYCVSVGEMKMDIRILELESETKIIKARSHQWIVMPTIVITSLLIFSLRGPLVSLFSYVGKPLFSASLSK